jgi:5-methylthioadenosine/S-adenosylhomocysteine deaminase
VAGHDNGLTSMIIAPDWLLARADQPAARGWGVRVIDGSIDSVGPISELRRANPDDEIIDAAGHAVLPGFVNTHTHLYGVLSHGIEIATPPSGFASFLDDFWWPQVENRLDTDMICAATEWGCVEMIRSGTTSFYDICEAPGALPGVLSAQADVVRPIGLRARLSFEATQRSGDDVARLGLEENSDFVTATRDNDMVTGLMCWHTTFTCDPDFIVEAAGRATELGVLSHAHCNEGTSEGEWCQERHGCDTMALYARLGVAGPGLLASQCVQLTPRDIELIASTGTKVSHMPLSNCEVGGGIAPIPELHAGSVTIGLGTDGYVNDMYEVMRGAFWIHKARLLDPSAMPASTVLDMATVGGATALGLDRVGRLEPGWSADLQVVSLDLPTPITAENLADQVLLWRNRHDVRDVMAAGRWLMRHREILNIDVERAKARTREEARRLWAR